MKNENLWARLLVGAVAGLTGTMVLQSIRSAEQKWLKQASPEIKEDPGRYMLRKAARLLPPAAADRLKKTEPVTSKLLAMGYGATFGGLYGILRKTNERAIWEGLALGFAAWIVGYLGWLPATGLMRPVWKHQPRQIAAPLAEHALYGVATLSGYRWLKQHLIRGSLIGP